MLNRKAVFIFIGASMPLSVFADMPSHNVPGERGIVFHDTMDAEMRAQPVTQRLRGDWCSADGWRYVGGEAVWILDRSCMSERARRVSASDAMPTPAAASPPIKR